MHCNWHTQETYMCTFASLCKHFFPVQIDIFFQFFCQGELRKQPNFTFCWFWLGKMHQNGLSGAYLGFKACQIQWHLLWVSTISMFHEKSQFQAKISHFVDFEWVQNASKLLEWCIFMVGGMPNPMALCCESLQLVPMKNLHHVAEPYILTFP